MILLYELLDDNIVFDRFLRVDNYFKFNSFDKSYYEKFKYKNLNKKLGKNL